MARAAGADAAQPRVQILEARHCAFVTFGERGAAERAAEELQNKLLVRGQRAKLCWGRPQERRPDAPPAAAPPPSMMPPQARTHLGMAAQPLTLDGLRVVEILFQEQLLQSVVDRSTGLG